MADKSVDLVLTDPPYGIDASGGVGGFGSSKTDNHYDDDWDTMRPSKEYFDEMLRIGKKVVIFGGNFFTDLLPVNGHWIVWDKVGETKFDNPFSKCELAWTNVAKKTVQKYVVIQQGFISEEKVRFHPTQKPVTLFEQIINDYTEEGEFVFDPFLGSGTSAIAAESLKRVFVGVDIAPKYVKIAQDRLSALSEPLF